MIWWDRQLMWRTQLKDALFAELLVGIQMLQALSLGSYFFRKLPHEWRWSWLIYEILLRLVLWKDLVGRVSRVCTSICIFLANMMLRVQLNFSSFIWEWSRYWHLNCSARVLISAQAWTSLLMLRRHHLLRPFLLAFIERRHLWLVQLNTFI